MPRVVVAVRLRRRVVAGVVRPRVMVPLPLPAVASVAAVIVMIEVVRFPCSVLIWFAPDKDIRP